MREKSTSSFIITIICTVISIVLTNMVVFWRQYTNGVILESWVDILWAANLSMIVQLVCNAILAFRRPARLNSILQAVMTAASLLSMVVFLIVFPLDFSPIGAGALNIVIRVVIVLALAGGLAGLIVHLVRSIAGTPYSEEAPQERSAD